MHEEKSYVGQEEKRNSDTDETLSIDSIPDEILNQSLTSEQVKERIANGQNNYVEPTTSRSMKSILKQNIFTLFNLILSIAFIFICLTGSLADGLFIIVLVVNTAIAVVVEWKAKKILDELSILTAQKVLIIRDGKIIKADNDEIVKDDIVLLRQSDQVPADFEVIKSMGMEIDESLITGESDGIKKQENDIVYSGTNVIAGSGLLRATAVGNDSYINKVSQEAKKFIPASSDLQNGINKILEIVSFIIVPMGLFIFISGIVKAGGMIAFSTGEWKIQLLSAVTAIIGMVPEGLVLLTSINFALAIVILGRQKVLVQEMNSVETLARVDTLMLDKTGTITTGQLALKRIVGVGDGVLSAGTFGVGDGVLSAGAFGVGDGVLSAGALGDGTNFLDERDSLAVEDHSPSGIKEAEIHTQSGIKNGTGLPAENISLTKEDLFAFDKLTAGTDANATAQAINKAVSENISNENLTQFDATLYIPFSSKRKYSAIFVEDNENKTGALYVMGAYEFLNIDDKGESVKAQMNKIAGTGSRVLLMSRIEGVSYESVKDIESGQKDIKEYALTPYCMFELGEDIRSDAKETLDYFKSQDVDVKVISGDNPKTVAVIAGKVGLLAGAQASNASPGANAGESETVAEAENISAGLHNTVAADNPGVLYDPGAAGIDASTLMGKSDEEVLKALCKNTVFGRVTPEQKLQFVKLLQKDGRTVAMTGDGVNDTLALKHADLGVAMGSGSVAAKAVSKIVLLDGKFSRLPSVLAQGRRVMANMERVSSLFFTKTVYSTIIAVLIGCLGVAYPFLPRHISFIGMLTIGIPAFFLAIPPNNTKYYPGFLGRVMRFSVPAGFIVAVFSVSTYMFFRTQTDMTLLDMRSANTFLLFLMALCVLTLKAIPLKSWRAGLVAAMLALGIVIYEIPFTSDFFRIWLPGQPVVWYILISFAIAGVLLVVLNRITAKYNDREFMRLDAINKEILLSRENDKK